MNKKVYWKDSSCSSVIPFELNRPRYFNGEVTNLLGEVEEGSTFKVLYDTTSDDGWIITTSFKDDLDNPERVKELCKERVEDWNVDEDISDWDIPEFYIEEYQVCEEHIECVSDIDIDLQEKD